MKTAREIMNSNYLSIDVNDTIAKLIGKTQKNNSQSVLVFEGKKYLGTIEKGFLAEKHIDTEKMKVKNVLKKRSKSKTQFYLPCVSEDENMEQICKKFAGIEEHILPVIEKTSVLGIIESRDVAREIANSYKTVSCSALASRAVVSAKPEDGVGKTLSTMIKKGIDHMPVIDGKELLGIVSMSDLINAHFWNSGNIRVASSSKRNSGNKAGYGRGEKTSSLDLPIKNFMSKKSLCCISPSTKIPQAIEVMTQNGVCSIILVENNRAVGILTLKDVIKDYVK